MKKIRAERLYDFIYMKSKTSKNNLGDSANLVIGDWKGLQRRTECSGFSLECWFYGCVHFMKIHWIYFYKCVVFQQKNLLTEQLRVRKDSTSAEGNLYKGEWMHSFWTNIDSLRLSWVLCKGLARSLDLGESLTQLITRSSHFVDPVLFSYMLIGEVTLHSTVTDGHWSGLGLSGAQGSPPRNCFSD